MIDPVNGVASATSISHLKLISGGGSTASAIPARDAAPPSDSATAVKAAPAAPATRVYIDRSASGVYVYRLVDASTGQVLVELPRAESGSLNVMDGYQPGAAAHVSA